MGITTFSALFPFFFADGIALLPLDIFLRLLAKFKEKNLPEKEIGSAIAFYAQHNLPDPKSLASLSYSDPPPPHSSSTSSSSASSLSPAHYRRVLEGLTAALPAAAASVPMQPLLGLLRCAIVLNASEGVKATLQRHPAAVSERWRSGKRCEGVERVWVEVGCCLLLLPVLPAASASVPMQPLLCCAIVRPPCSGEFMFRSAPSCLPLPPSSPAEQGRCSLMHRWTICSCFPSPPSRTLTKLYPPCHHPLSLSHSRAGGLVTDASLDDLLMLPLVLPPVQHFHLFFSHPPAPLPTTGQGRLSPMHVWMMWSCLPSHVTSPACPSRPTLATPSPFTSRAGALFTDASLEDLLMLPFPSNQSNLPFSLSHPPYHLPLFTQPYPIPQSSRGTLHRCISGGSSHAGDQRRAGGVGIGAEGLNVLWCGEVVTGAGEVVTGAGEVVTGAGEVVTGAGEVVTGAGGMGDAAGGMGDAAGGMGDAAGGMGDAAGGMGDAAGGMGDAAGGMGDAAHLCIRQAPPHSA
ncbi:unnamed protein product [Closterium sp. NIES-53]